MKGARVELSEANAVVTRIHRHHKPVTGHRFSIAAAKDGQIVGVAICGRPVARGPKACLCGTSGAWGVCKKCVLEVNRCATDGTRNACSYLYGKAARIASELGFRAVITYTLTEEDGASLRACGWWPETLDERNTDWSCESRPRKRSKGTDLGQKVRWLWLTGADNDARPSPKDGR